MIYFIRDTQADRVKIGKSINPWSRLAQLQTSSHTPLSLEAVLPGDGAAERGFHEKFRDVLVRGEWFQWSGPVQNYVATANRIERAPKSSPIPLRQYRYDNGLTLAQLGKMVGVTGPHLSRVEREGSISLGLAIRLSKLTGIAPRAFLKAA